jgi:hypothetical protein
MPRPRLQARLFVAFDSVEVMIETAQNALKEYVLLMVVDKSLGSFLIRIEGEVFWGSISWSLGSQIMRVIDHFSVNARLVRELGRIFDTKFGGLVRADRANQPAT